MRCELALPAWPGIRVCNAPLSEKVSSELMGKADLLDGSIGAAVGLRAGKGPASGGAGRSEEGRTGCGCLHGASLGDEKESNEEEGGEEDRQRPASSGWVAPAACSCCDLDVMSSFPLSIKFFLLPAAFRK